MKKVFALVLAAVITISAVVGGTIAYFTDTEQDTSVFTVGNIDIEQLIYERAVDENGNWIAAPEYKATFGDDTYTPDLLQEFTNNKPAWPAYYEDENRKFDDRNGSQAASGEGSHQQSWAQVGAPGSNQLLDDSVCNVIDKFVFVKNTGRNDAFFRTIVAIECPNDTIADKLGILTNNKYTQEIPEVEENLNRFIEVDGVRYFISSYRHEAALKPGEVSRPSFLQVFLDPSLTQEEAAAFGNTFDILVATQAVQANLGKNPNAADSLKAAFGDITADNHPWSEAPDKPVIKDVDNDEDLKKALTSDAKNIVVTLDNDVTYDVAAWAANGMGSANTEDITIIGNGNTITFHQTDSDWNNIVTKGAKLTIMDAHVTNSGKNDGPWNRHDLNFACDVELINVTSDKAIALKAGGTLKNVTIDDANDDDTYALWIQPKGQTVTLEDCTIDMLDATDGRGIKIDNQYIEASENKGETAGTTLIVKNTTFKTEEKSAILVKTELGANIIVEDIAISGVAADPVNAVWVDEAAKTTVDLVKVTGAKKIVEGIGDATVANTASAVTEALANGKSVILTDDVELSSELVVSSDAVIDLNGKVLDSNADRAISVSGNGTVTIENGTIKSDDILLGIFGDSKLVVNDCVLEGKYGFGMNGTTTTENSSAVFTNCTIKVSSGYNAAYISAKGTYTFKNCTLEGGAGVLVRSGNVTLDGCTITANGYYGKGTAQDKVYVNYAIESPSGAVEDGINYWTNESQNEGSTGDCVVIIDNSGEGYDLKSVTIRNCKFNVVNSVVVDGSNVATGYAVRYLNKDTTAGAATVVFENNTDLNGNAIATGNIGLVYSK